MLKVVSCQSDPSRRKEATTNTLQPSAVLLPGVLQYDDSDDSASEYDVDSDA